MIFSDKTRKGSTLRIAIYAVAAVFLLLAAVALVLYVQANRLPADYMPAVLSPQQRRRQVDNFAGQLMDFHRKAQHSLPYTLTVSQRRMNAYLASLDEIASDMPGSNFVSGQMNQMMADAGIADPAVAFGSDVVTLMVRSTRREKVLSVKLGFSFPSVGKLQVRLLAARVGRLSMPDDLAGQVLSQLKYEARRWLEDRETSDSTHSAAASLGPGDVGGAMAAVVAAIDDEPIDTEVTIGGKRIRIVDVRIEPGGDMTLHVEPLGRAKPPPPGVGRRNHAVRTELPEELRNR